MCEMKNADHDIFPCKQGATHPQFLQALQKLGRKNYFGCRLRSAFNPTTLT